MIDCPKCSWKNEDDAIYCNNCGNNLIIEKNNFKNSKKENIFFEMQIKDFTKHVEQVGKKAGEKIQQSVNKFGEETQYFGNKIEDITKKTSNRVEMWYNTTFGIFGPLLSSFIGLIVIRLVIEGLKIGAKDNPILADVGDALFSNLFLLFIVFLISGYSEYLSKRYRSFRWINPILIGVSVIIVVFVVENIISMVGSASGEMELASAISEWIKNYLLMIFIIVILAGYLILVVKTSLEKDQIK